MNGVQALKQEDIFLLGPLQPTDWDDIRTQYALHFGQEYYTAIKYIFESELVGVAQLVTYGDSAWMGNVIVKEDCRSHGIGRALTEELIRIATEEKQVKSLYLIATDMGVPVYQKFGFKEFGAFNSFHRDHDVFYEEDLDESDPHFRPADYDELKEIIELDHLACGENREVLLREHLEECEVYSALKNGDSAIDGFYMPTIGEGLIVAKDEEGGVKLLERHIMDNNMVVLPTQNTVAADLLIENGFSVNRRSIAMQYGQPKKWNPEMIYSRISNYVG